MVSLEQVKLLESKVSRAIDYVQKVTGENAQLKGKLDSYQKRIEELEVLIQRFREDQSRIEDGILSALDRLNQFEDALESRLSGDTAFSSESKGAEKDKPLSVSAAPEGREEEPRFPSAETDTSEEEPDLSAEPRENGGELDIF